MSGHMFSWFTLCLAWDPGPGSVWPGMHPSVHPVACAVRCGMGALLVRKCVTYSGMCNAVMQGWRA